LLDVQELHIIAQLVDNIEIILGKLEDAYSDKNAENFAESKNEILKSQINIAEIIK